MKRAIKGIILGALEPNVVSSEMPRFEFVDPASLLVDEVYQRTLSEKSIRLIRRIISGWEWARFKPPVVAVTENGMEVIDGQHTAIAAASHPGISQIPVIIVQAESVAERANAFVGHNRDRLNISAMQMHYSALAAGNEDAQTIAQVCERANVTILKYPPTGGVFKPGETLALAAIASLVNKRGAMAARKVLEVISNARCAPVASNHIKAVEYLLYDKEYVGTVDADDLTSTLIRMGGEVDTEGKVFAAAHKIQAWRGIAVTLFRNTRKRKKAA